MLGLLGPGFSCDETVNNGAVSLATTERVSLDAVAQEADGECYHASLSGDGTLLCFESEATNLVPGDTNGVPDVFVKNLLTGAVTRVSTGSAGQQANLPCIRPRISRNGQYVVFETESDSAGFLGQAVYFQIYRKNLQTGTLGIVSEDQFGDISFGDSTQACVSDDGRYVAFVSKGNNINGVDGVGRVCRRDMDSAAIFAAANTTGQDASDPAISGDGTHLAYVLVGALSIRQVWWRPVGGGATLVSFDPVNIGQGNGHSTAPQLSTTGQYVVYASAATNVSPEDRTGISIFFRDMLAPGNAVTTTVSVNSDGETSLDDCSRPRMTPDARYIAFGSKAGNLVANDTNLTSDVFVHDRVTGDTVRASVRTFGQQTLPGATSDGPSLPDDGSFVVFESISPTLVDDDLNGAVDLFLRSLLW